jgi:hypothetical protein
MNECNVDFITFQRMECISGPDNCKTRQFPAKFHKYFPKKKRRAGPCRHPWRAPEIIEFLGERCVPENQPADFWRWPETPILSPIQVLTDLLVDPLNQPR